MNIEQNRPPMWLQHLLPWMRGGDSDAARHQVEERVAALEPRLGELSATVEWRVRALCVREAMRHAGDADAVAACERVASLCETRGRGEHVDDAEMRAAADAARVAARSTLAAWAAWAAARAAAWASRWAAADRLTDAILTELERDLDGTKEES